MRVAVVTHDLLGDPFWTPFDAGLEAASAEHGLRLLRFRLERYDPDAFEELLGEAIAAAPDGLLTTLPQPERFDVVLRPAIADGLPVGLLNTLDTRPADERLPVQLAIGADDMEAGRCAARLFLAAGPVGRALGLDHYRDRNTCHSQRLLGFADVLREVGVEVSLLGLDIAVPDARAVLAEALVSIGAGDAILTLGPPGWQAVDALIAEGAALGARHISFDITREALGSVAGGATLGLVECQPFLQAYAGVVLMRQALLNGLCPVAPVLTGPRIIDRVAASRLLSDRKGLAAVPSFQEAERIAVG
ncbi:MAG: substrate-binding domain-containing protein [Dehalococcoidia bacterium]